MRTSTDAFGTFKLMVWNQLRTGSGQPNSLYFTAAVRAIDPYIGVKCAKRELAVNQMDDPCEASDASKMTTQSRQAFPDKFCAKKSSGFNRTSHASVKDLLRRPDYVGTTTIPAGTAPESWLRVARLPAFAGKRHCALMATYTYWTGTNRYWIVTNNSTNATGNFMVSFNQPDFAQVKPDFSIVPVEHPPTFAGTTMPRTVDKNQIVVDVPFYNATPSGIFSEWIKRL